MLETETSFGAWLRQRCRQLDLTQTELAARIGYSVVTIRKLERDELRPSKQLAETPCQFLEVALEQQAGIIAFARAGVAPATPAAAQSTPSHNHNNLLPQLTPFIGRTAELSELAHRLHDPACRLLTLVGPGGMGKSRLALAAAQQILDGGQVPICYVPLAALPAGASLAAAIIAAIGYPIQPAGRSLEQQLIDYLRQKQLLLVLDNFEHLLESAGLITDMLQAALGLRVLVTSRERLQLSSETVFPLSGMECPPQVTSDNASEYSAVKLFEQSARRIRPDFTLDAGAVTEVAYICQLVAGMPLGIILAAAWVDLLSPQEIGQEISQSLDFLETEWRDMPERQRSIRAVFAHTWGRLTEIERAVFMRLAVFRGGFTRQAAQGVADASLRTISALVNKSLLQYASSGRYTIHELLRQYAEAELEAAGQSEDARAVHCAYYAEYLHQREAGLKGRRQALVLQEIDADFENVRAAWQWAVARRDYGAAGRTLEALYWFFEMRTLFQAGLGLLRLGREQLAPLAGEAPHPIWGRIMARMLGQNSAFYEPPLESRARVETGLAIAQQDENQAEIAFCLWRLAVIGYLSEDSIGAISYFEQSLVHYQALDDRFYQGYVLKDLGILYITLGQSDRGEALIQQSLHLRRQTGDPDGLATSLGATGWISYNRGRYSEAEACWQESHQLRHTARLHNFQASILFQSAWPALFNRGDLDSVRTLAEEVQRAAVAIGDFESKHRSLVLLGFLAGMREEYQACRQFFQQVRLLNFPYFPFTTSWEQMGLCLAACGLADLPAARQHLQKILEISLIHQWPANAAKALTFAAILVAKTGKPERATELLALVFDHPLSPKGWLAQWPLIKRLRTELAASLTSVVFRTAWARGESFDLMAATETVLAELAGDEGSGDRLSALDNTAANAA